jgi:hypothetical protein
MSWVRRYHPDSRQIKRVMFFATIQRDDNTSHGSAPCAKPDSFPQLSKKPRSWVNQICTQRVETPDRGMASDDRL